MYLLETRIFCQSHFLHALDCIALTASQLSYWSLFDQMKNNIFQYQSYDVTVERTETLLYLTKAQKCNILKLPLA